MSKMTLKMELEIYTIIVRKKNINMSRHQILMIKGREMYLNQTL